jgi:capsular polysaccharide biosynthesis protein/GGDEF domain-containing protein
MIPCTLARSGPLSLAAETSVELRTYLAALRRHWLLALLGIVGVMAGTVAYTANQQPLYEASARYIVKPAAQLGTRNDDQFMTALALLSGRTEIATTFAEAANSRSIHDQAAEGLALSPQQRSALEVRSRVVAGTNILEISAQGADPTLVTAFANAIGERTVSYVSSLYEVLELQLLDPAAVPDQPVQPRWLLNLALGAVLAVVLAVSLVFLAELRRAPAEAVGATLLDRESGAFSHHYFSARLREEISRSSRSGQPVAVALLDLDPNGALEHTSVRHRQQALERMVGLARRGLRDEDVVARLDNELLGVLLPDTDELGARERIGLLRGSFATAAVELSPGDPAAECLRENLAGVAAFDGRERATASSGPVELLARARLALDDARVAANQ